MCSTLVDGCKIAGTVLAFIQVVASRFGEEALKPSLSGEDPCTSGHLHLSPLRSR